MSMKDVLAVILGGGQGTRLFPLTTERAKPAVPLAGKYRLIDIPMSNCFHANIDKIAILTQFNSVSLHRHIWHTYRRDIFTPGWVQILAAEQTPNSRDWYQGTADAVRKQITEIISSGAKYVLILAGDHLYRMDYKGFVEHHIANDADITVAVQPVEPEVASSLGLLKLNDDGRIGSFVEKPKDPAVLEQFTSGNDPEKPYMASMGIYVFNLSMLLELLDRPGNDFGKDLIPNAIDEDRGVFGYVFDGYWEDIGTIQRFYKVNLDMAKTNPPFDFYDAQRPIYTHARFLPGSEIHDSQVDNVLLADGSRIYDSIVRESVIGLRSIVHQDATVIGSIIMGADDYETEQQQAHNARIGIPNIGVGPNTVIKGTIVDKNARIGRDVNIRSLPDRPDQEHKEWVSRDGIVIIPKGAIIPDGTVI